MNTPANNEIVIPDIFPYRPSAQEVVDLLSQYVGLHESVLRNALIKHVHPRFHERLLSDGTGDGIMGHVVQRFSGLEFSDNSPLSDCSDAEQKLSRLKCDYSPKETVALSMIHPEREFMRGATFEDSPLWRKSRRLLICPVSAKGILLAPYILDLADVRHVIEPDWNAARDDFLENGVLPSSALGTIVQARPKGPGGAGVPKTRAWYLRTPFLAASFLRGQGKISDETFHSLVLNTPAMRGMRKLRSELEPHLTTIPSGTVTPTAPDLLLP